MKALNYGAICAEARKLQLRFMAARGSSQKERQLLTDWNDQKTDDTAPNEGGFFNSARSAAAAAAMFWDLRTFTPSS